MIQETPRSELIRLSELNEFMNDLKNEAILFNLEGVFRAQSSIWQAERFAPSSELEKAKKRGYTFCSHGGVAQLGEHLPCKQGVKSSNLFISTI